MAKPQAQTQADDSGGYVPTKIPGVIRLGNQYRRDPNYPPEPTPPVRKPAELLLKPIAKGYAKGGLVKGPGTATSDSIPAKLSKGEFIIPSDTVKQYGKAFFNKLIGGAKEPDTDDKGRPKLVLGGSPERTKKKPVSLNYLDQPQDRKAWQDQGQTNLVAPVNYPISARPPAMSPMQLEEQSRLKQVTGVGTLGNKLSLAAGSAGNKVLDTAAQTVIPNDYLSTRLQAQPQPAPAPTAQPQPAPVPIANKQVVPGQAAPTVSTAPTAPTGALGNNRIDLGDGNYIGDNKPRSTESVNRMKALMTPSTDAQKASRAESAALADDRYAWARNREAERQQAAQQQNQQAQQDQLNAQIQQAQAALMSPNLGGKHSAAAFLASLNDQQGRNQQANQFGQTMEVNRQAGQELGKTKAAEMEQQRQLKVMDLMKPTALPNRKTYNELGGITGEEPGGFMTYDPKTGGYSVSGEANQPGDINSMLGEAYKKANATKDPKVRQQLLDEINRQYQAYTDQQQG